MPEAGARPRRGRADVPLPAPSTKEDVGTDNSAEFPQRLRESRYAPEAGADLRSKYADVPLPAPWSKEDFGKDRFNRLHPRVSANPEVPSAAGADLRSKYADVPLPAPIPKC